MKMNSTKVSKNKYKIPPAFKESNKYHSYAISSNIRGILNVLTVGF